MPTKGTNSGVGGAGGSRPPQGETSITTKEGVTIDLSTSPIIYGDDDPYVTGPSRAVIEAFEDKRVKNKIEFALMVEPNGIARRESRGGSGSAIIRGSDVRASSLGSHNHPREFDVLGGTFSTADLEVLSDMRVNANGTKTFRATAKEGTYSMTWTHTSAKNTDVPGFMRAYRQEGSRLRQLYESGQMHFNEYLIGLHNWLLNNRRVYNYDYTLERRK